MIDYTITKLEKSDYYNGFLELLEQLTVVHNTQPAFDDFCHYFDNTSSDIYVIKEFGKSTVIGTGSILIEQKFIHSFGRVGHIEDIVISNDYRGQGLGKILIKYLIDLARKNTCYKVILNCSEENTKFYEKCGFVNKGVEMALYFK